jgi:CubicO group peptidase (beta-lactamase class C family)
LVLAGLFGPVARGAPAADTQAARQLQKLVDIARRPPPDDMAAFTELVEPPPGAPPGPPPPGARAPILEVIKQLQVHSIGPATETEADLIARAPMLESWVRLHVELDPARPDRIKTLSLLPAPRPADVPAPASTPAAIRADVDQKARAKAAADVFSGALLIAKDGQPLFQAAYGQADRAAGIANGLDTQFRFGSMGKMFTEVAVLQLAQAGKLDLKAPIGTYLKHYPNAEIARTVTINELLTHTGGTGDFFGPQFTAHRLELRDPKDYVALFGAHPPLFPPGSRVQYSNYGFILLGRIVEVVSGLDYDDYLARNIFAPAGMTATGNQPEAIRLLKRSVSYMRLPGGQPGKVGPADETLPYRGTPAGGGYSTVGDMLKFANALMSDKLLDAEHTRLLTQGGAPGPDGKLIPYEFQTKDADGRRVLGHNGGAPGMNGELRIYPASGYTVVVLANRDPPAAAAMASFIAERLP